MQYFWFGKYLGGLPPVPPWAPGGAVGAYLTAALLLVTCVGIMAYTMARRTRDIGIRLALGAEPANVERQVLRETFTLVLMACC
jgi:ABC-type antimicrobial peptide transport system permease subunit